MTHLPTDPNQHAAWPPEDLVEDVIELRPGARVHAHLEAALVALTHLERLALQHAGRLRALESERWWERLARPCETAATYDEVWLLRRDVADRIHAVEALLGLDVAWPEPPLPRRASVTPAPPRASVAPDPDMTKGPRRANG